MSEPLPPRRRRALVTPSPYLNLRSEILTEGGERLILSGELDMGTVLPFRDAAFTIIGKRPALFILDLSLMTRFDIVGLNTLLTIHRVSHIAAVPICIVPSERLRLVLEETGLTERFDLALQLPEDPTEEWNVLDGPHPAPASE